MSIISSKSLRVGDQGHDVTQLQLALLEHKFNPGVIDGEFGVGTEQALIAFQLSKGLLADGVAGPRSLLVLGLIKEDILPDATTGMSLQVAARMCPSAPLGNIKANLPVVLGSLIEHRLHDRTMVLMAVATIRVETAPFLPMNEGLSRFNTSPTGHAFDLYDNRHDIGNRGAPDGERFKGRGFIQLTGRANYTKYGPRLSPPLDLVAKPELANTPTVAADLLCLFLGDKERAIKEALLDANYKQARKLVNGGSHGLEPFTEAYRVGNGLLPSS